MDTDYSIYQNDKEEQEIELLLRYFEYNCTEEENLRVEQWIARSNQNSKIAKDIYHIYLATNCVDTLRSVSPENALMKVKGRIHPKICMLQWIQRIAAILILPLLLTIGILIYPKESPEIPFVEMKMNPGMIGKMQLPDGTEVWLNGNTYIKYPSTFSKDRRNVYLDGEAYFSVVKNKKCPFFVQTPQTNVSIEVTGTSFNLDAYSINNKITTTLLSGSVQFHYRNAENQSLHIDMHPNEQIVFENDEKNAHFEATYPAKDIAWKERQIILRNTPLVDVLWILSKRFNVEFVMEKETLRLNAFTRTFNDQQLDSILDFFQWASGIHHRTEHVLGKDGEELKRKVILY